MDLLRCLLTLGLESFGALQFGFPCSAGAIELDLQP